MFETTTFSGLAVHGAPLSQQGLQKLTLQLYEPSGFLKSQESQLQETSE